MGLETALQEPPAMVAQAENKAEWMKLPGIEEFAAGLRQAVRDAREKNAVARVTSWEIIRQCYDYGNRAVVRARVDVMNHLPDGSFKRGRPHFGHRLAMEAIAECCGVRLRTVEHWQQSFNAALRCGVVKLEGFSEMLSEKPPRLADRVEEIDALIEAKAAETKQNDCTEEEPLKPEALGLRLAQGFLRKAKLEEALNPPLVVGLLKALHPVLVRHGYSVYCGKRRSSA